MKKNILISKKQLDESMDYIMESVFVSPLPGMVSSIYNTLNKYTTYEINDSITPDGEVVKKLTFYKCNDAHEPVVELDSEKALLLYIDDKSGIKMKDEKARKAIIAQTIRDWVDKSESLKYGMLSQPVSY